MKVRNAAAAMGFALVCLLMALMAGPALAEGAAPSEIRAQKVAPSQLLPGDRFVIVSEPGHAALSLNVDRAEKGIGAVNITMAHTRSRQVLTAMPEDIAVFEIESAGGEDVYLKCASGYLTSSGDAKKIYYAQAPEPCSAWRCVDEAILRNVNARYESDGKLFDNCCVDFFSGERAFRIYRRFDDMDASAFTCAFYKLGNSAPAEAVIEDSRYLLPVFNTSDVHGYLADATGGPTEYLLAYISDKVKDVRGHGDDARKDLAVLVDGGDIYAGNVMSNVIQGQSLSPAFDIMGYDAVTIGNHEFDWQFERAVDPDSTMMDYSFRDYVAENKIPVVVCNLYQNGEKVPYLQDYVILEKTARDRDGHELPVRIGVIGMAGTFGDSISRNLFRNLGYGIKLDYDAVNALAESLEASGQCDATILIAHAAPKNIAKGLGENTAIDLLFGGHVHHTEHWTTPWGLTYLEASCNGKAYAYADLAFDSVNGSAVFAGVQNPNYFWTNDDIEKLAAVPENADELDEAVVQLTDTAIEVVSHTLNSEVGVITEPVMRYEYLPRSGERATTAGNWVASIYARIVDADVGFVNAGGLRKDMDFEPGQTSRTITLADVFEMFPFENSIYGFELTYAELLEALEYSMTRGGLMVLSNMVGVDCYYTQAGVNAIVTPDGEAVYVNGVWKDGWKDRKIRVAMCDYSATTMRDWESVKNPFVAWSETPRLYDDSQIDVDGALRVLVQEAAANDGHLAIDTEPHYIEGMYAPEAE